MSESVENIENIECVEYIESTENEKVYELVNKKINEYLDYIKSKNNVMTNPRRSDGFGEHVKCILYSIAFAKHFNFDFVYTPMEEIEHFDNNPETISKIENILGFIDNYPLNKLDLQRKCEDDSGRIADFIHKNTNTVTNSTNASIFTDNPKIDEARNIFIKNKKYSDYFDNSFYNIAIHIRRANTFDTTRGYHNKLLDYQMRLYTDEYYIKLINTLNIEPCNSLIHIYSQELDKDKYIKGILKNNIVFHLNEELCTTFPAMVFSDLLITGASTLGYSAGLLRVKEQPTYYHIYLHPPLDHWVAVDSNTILNS